VAARPKRSLKKRSKAHQKKVAARTKSRRKVKARRKKRK